MIANLSYDPPLGESDHLCLRFNVACGKEEVIREEKESLNIYKCNLEAVIAELGQYDWDDLLTSNFQQDYQVFFDILEKLMRKHTPVKTPRKRKKNLYMTRDSVRLKNKKLRLWRKYTKTKGLFDRRNYALTPIGIGVHELRPV